MKKLTREWVRKAEADLAVVRTIAAAKPPLHDAVCFHCQQAAEKYLKAVLQELGLPIPYTHDLAHLVLLITPHQATMKPLRRKMANLSRYAVDYRYPGHQATIRQARASIAHSRQLRA